jgi:predicted chitinase
MALFPWEEPFEEVPRCYEQLRDLALEAVQDPAQVISPVAVVNIACAGWALEEEYEFGALLFLLAAVPGLGDARGKTAAWFELAAAAADVGRRLRDAYPLIGLKELVTQFLFDRHDLERLKQRRALYRQEVGSVLTAAVLKAIMPKLSAAEVAGFLGPLNAALVEFDIITPQRWMPFLAECAEESGQLRSMTELPSHFASSASKFKGRGALQLTGLGNYRAAGKALGLDLEHHPDWVASDAAVGFRAGGWFWKSNGLNERADRATSVADFDKISNVINRGTPNKPALGADVRRAFFRRARDAWVEYKNRCQTALIAGKIVQI